MSKLVGVGDNAHAVYPLRPYLDGQHEVRATRITYHEGWLTVDLLHLATVLRWQEAPRRPNAESRYRQRAGDRACRSSLDLSATICPEGHVFAEHVHQCIHVASLDRPLK